MPESAEARGNTVYVFHNVRGAQKVHRTIACSSPEKARERADAINRSSFGTSRGKRSRNSGAGMGFRRG